MPDAPLPQSPSSPASPDPPIDADRLADNVAAVRARIAAAAERAGRDPGAIQIVPATKYVGVAGCRALLALGFRALGENRLQALAEKAAALPAFRGWHFFGHVQRNKARKVAATCQAVQSLDSRRVAESLDRHVVDGARATPLAVYVEVNLSGEPAKTGADPAEAQALVARVRELGGLALVGLMTMGPHTPDRARVRQSFLALAALRDRLALPGESLELSMGMSGDFELAVEAGATLVRLGSVLYEGALNR